MYKNITISDRSTESITSNLESVSSDVDPKSVVQTSPEIFEDDENTFMSK